VISQSRWITRYKADARRVSGANPASPRSPPLADQNETPPCATGPSHQPSALWSTRSRATIPEISETTCYRLHSGLRWRIRRSHGWSVMPQVIRGPAILSSCVEALLLHRIPVLTMRPLEDVVTTCGKCRRIVAEFNSIRRFHISTTARFFASAPKSGRLRRKLLE